MAASRFMNYVVDKFEMWMTNLVFFATKILVNAIFTWKPDQTA